MKRKILFIIVSIIVLASSLFIFSGCGKKDVYYTITFANYDGSTLQSTSVKEGDMPLYTGSAPTKDADGKFTYTFSGWTPGVDVASSDATYTASFTKEVIMYDLTIDLGNGNTTSTKVAEVTKDMFSFDLTKEGYIFRGYSLNGVKIYDENGEKVNDFSLSANMMFTAIFDKATKVEITYTLYNPITHNLVSTLINLTSDIGEASETAYYESGSKVNLSVDNKGGYTFLGWYSEGTLLSNEKTYEMTVDENDKVIEARFEYTKCSISVSSLDSNLGKVSINGEYKDEDSIDTFFTSEVTLKARAITGYEFSGWYVGDSLLSSEENYSFKVETKFLALTAKFIPSPNTPYKVEHYTQNIADDDYTLYETDNLTGTTNTLTNAVAKEYEGFASPSITQVNINANGDTVIKLYYTRNTFSIAVGQSNVLGGSITEGGTFKFGAEVTISVTLNPGYTFLGWFVGEEMISNELSFTFNVNSKYLDIVARLSPNDNTPYTVEHYIQNLDDNNYSLKKTDNLTGTTDTLTNGNVKSYDGFTSQEFSQVNIDGTGTAVIKVYYTRNTYNLSLSKNIDKAGNVTGKGSYKYGKEVTLYASVNEGYTFVGWYNGDAVLSTEETLTYTVMSAATIEARFSVNKYTVTLDNQASGVGITGIVSGALYEYGTEITLQASNVPSGYEVKWTIDGTSEQSGTTLTFSVPSKDVVIIVTIESSKPYKRVGNKIYFGKFPQSLEKDSAIINSLNSKYKPSNFQSWDYFEYMNSSSQINMVYYRDVDLDGDGAYDYRGIFIYPYRPYQTSYSSNESYSYQDDNGYYEGTYYWFKYETIEWDVLEEANGKALIISHLCLDSQDFYYDGSRTNSFYHNKGEGSANNYKLSDIRLYLINDFYKTAFNNLQRQLVQDTTVDNSAASTGRTPNSYSCANTTDKVFLLSCKEVNTYFTTDSARQAKGTDYAKSQGLLVGTSGKESGYCTWLLRSPFFNYSLDVYRIWKDGTLGTGRIDCTYFGIRPACWIKLD